MEAGLGLFLLFVFARLCGAAAERLGQPSSVGELSAGVVAGGIALIVGGYVPAASVVFQSDVLEHAAEAGIFFLVLAAAIDMKPREIASHSMVSFLVAAGGVIVPLAAGTALGLAFLPQSDARTVQAVFIGVALSITAIPTTVRMLGDLGLMHSRVGQTIVAAAIFDDVLGLALLAVLTALIERGAMPEAGDLALMALQIALFFAITIAMGVHVYPRVSRHLKVLQLASAEFGIIMAVAIGYAVLAEVLGMHWIMGVFMAGLFFEPGRVGVRAYDETRIVVAGVTGGFFAPVFFASIGAAIDPGALVAAPLFVVAVIVAAFAAKLLGSGLPALAAGFAPREAVAVGAGMSSRGAVELVVIAIAVQAGLFAAPPPGEPETLEHAVPAALVMMAVVTTLCAPPVLKALIGKSAAAHKR